MLLRRLLLRVDEIFLVGALEVLNVAAFEAPDARGDFIDYVMVVRDEQNCSWIFLQGDVQRVD